MCQVHSFESLVLVVDVMQDLAKRTAQAAEAIMLGANLC